MFDVRPHQETKQSEECNGSAHTGDMKPRAARRLAPWPHALPHSLTPGPTAPRSAPQPDTWPHARPHALPDTVHFTFSKL